jgi:arylsulfatase A-like enzyme
MPFDPITAETTVVAPSREPVLVHAGQRAAAESALAAHRARTGRAPNLLIVLMDDVGWGDFGCYGGGVMTGAPTPHIDRLAREGMLLTSCYSEPSCTPSRASLMTGRLPMRHGLLVPPMYGAPGGLQGEVTLPQLLSDAGYVTQAVGKWHMGENVESQPQNVGFDDFYGFLSVSDMYTEWRDPYFFPEIVYSEARTEWVRNEPFNKCWLHATRGQEAEVVEEVTIPVLSELDDRWAAYSIDFIRRMAGGEAPWFLYHCTRGAHFDNYPHERFQGTSPARHPYKDTIIELDDIVGRLVAALEETGQAQDTLVFISSDNGPEMETWPDAAYTPFRCAKGSTWEGGVRVLDLFATALTLAGAADKVPTDRYIDSVDQTSFLLTEDGESNRKFHYYWLLTSMAALRVGEYKYVMRGMSEDDRDVLNPGGFSGSVEAYAYGKLFNLWLDPKETRSYLIRKLVYIELLQQAIAAHQRTFREFPNRPPAALRR